MADRLSTFRISLDLSPLRRWWPRRSTSRQHQSLLRLIAAATEQRIPLAPLLAAWAQDERGVQRERVARLAELLSAGAALPDALEQTGALSEEQTLAVRFGAQSGALAASLRRALADSQPEFENPGRTWKPTMAYVAIVVVLMALISAFLAIKIQPVLVQILDDFSLERPAALNGSIRLMQFAEHYWWLLALAALAGVWSLFSARPGRLARRAIGERVSNSLRELRASEVLDKLSIAAEAGRPMSGALSTLARYHFHPAMRSKLLFVRNEVEQGAQVWPSLADAGILTPAEARLLDSADRLDNRAWALRRIALAKRRRTLRRLDRASQLLLPAAVLVLGAFVLLQGLALFLPLTEFVVSNL